MLDYMLALGLVILICTHGLLVKKCQSLTTELPEKTSQIEAGMVQIRDLLDEALDYLNDAPVGNPLMAGTPPSESIPQMILSTLLSRTGMGLDDAPTQPNQWEIYPPNEPTPTTE